MAFWSLSRLSPSDVLSQSAWCLLRARRCWGSRPVPDRHPWCLGGWGAWAGSSLCLTAPQPSPPWNSPGVLLLGELSRHWLGLAVSPLPAPRTGDRVLPLLVLFGRCSRCYFDHRTFALFMEKTKTTGRNSSSVESDLFTLIPCCGMGGRGGESCVLTTGRVLLVLGAGRWKHQLNKLSVFSWNVSWQPSYCLCELCNNPNRISQTFNSVET